MQIIPGNNGTVTWSKHSGPDSGTLNNAGSTTATFSNPNKGGVYQFDLDYVGRTTRTQLLLPLAGPEINMWVTNEVQYLQTWAANYRTNAGWTRKVPYLAKYIRAYDLFGLGMSLDWTGYFTSASGPCLLPGTELSFSPRHTIYGIVVDRYRLSNLLTAYLGRAMTGLSEEALIYRFGTVATPDDEHDVESYRIGFDIFAGSTLEQAMQAHGYAQQKPNTWDVKLWPNNEAPTGGGINRPSVLN
jgi:hypothetical protein